MPDLAYVGDIVLLSDYYKEMQYLLEAVSHHAATVTIYVNAMHIALGQGIEEIGSQIYLTSFTSSCLQSCLWL